MISIDASVHANTTVVHVSGALDHVTYSQFDAAIAEQIGAGARHLAIDLSRVDHIDDVGLRQLYSSLKKARRSGGDLSLAQPQEVVMDALTASRLHEVIAVYETLAEAFSQS